MPDSTTKYVIVDFDAEVVVGLFDTEQAANDWQASNDGYDAAVVSALSPANADTATLIKGRAAEAEAEMEDLLGG